MTKRTKYEIRAEKIARLERELEQAHLEHQADYEKAALSLGMQLCEHFGIDTPREIQELDQLLQQDHVLTSIKRILHEQTEVTSSSFRLAADY